MPATEQQTGLDDLFADLVKGDDPQGTAQEPEQQLEPTQDQPTQQQVDDALAAAKELGIDTSGFQSSAELVKAMHQRLTSLQQEREKLTPYAEMGKRFAPHYDKLQELLSKQDPERVDEDTGEWNEEKYWESVWQAPKWDDSWTQLIKAGILQEDQGGLVKAADPRFEPEAAQVNKYLMSLRQFEQQRLASNPYKDTWDKIRPVIDRILDEKLGQFRDELIGQISTEKTFDRYRSELGDYLWQKDPVTGEYQQTEYGQKFFNYIDRLEKMGIQASEDAMIQLALDAVGRPEQKDEEPERANEERKQAFLDKAKKRSAHSTQVEVSDKEPASEADIANFIEKDLTERLKLK